MLIMLDFCKCIFSNFLTSYLTIYILEYRSLASAFTRNQVASTGGCSCYERWTSSRWAPNGRATRARRGRLDTVRGVELQKECDMFMKIDQNYN